MGRCLFNGISIVIRGTVDGSHRAVACTALPVPDRTDGRARVGTAPLVGAERVRGSGAAVHPQPGVLGCHAGDAFAGRGRNARFSALIGVPLGIAAAHRPRLYAGLRPVLDLMQTLPTFVYLIPTLVLFGLGVVPGLISTVIFALPAPIRLTHLGISSVPKPLIEAGEAFGATPCSFCKVELPCAAGTIIADTQCIMLSLSMVVIAALVGGGGLGVPVVRALSTLQVGMGFEESFAIVLVAILLDRSAAERARITMPATVEFERVDILFPQQRGRAGRTAIASP